MTKKKTTAEFIEDAIRIHGDKYDYSKTEYIKSSLKVKIICKEHGEFEQTPNSHIGIQKQGCSRCSYIIRGKKSRETTEKFIDKAKLIHGNLYDYTKTNYINSNKKIIIICSKHGEFEQTPNAHIQSQGCPKCGCINNGINRRKPVEKFIEEAQKIHNNNYDYSKINYINNLTKIKIICKIHGEFEQTSSAHVNNGQGCFKCGCINSGLNQRKSVEKFIKEATILHGNKYDYSKVNFKTQNDKIIITCKIHGDFNVVGYHHIYSLSGCSKCSGKYQPTTDEFIEKAKLIHGDTYEYSKVNYINSSTKIIIICEEHGEFEQTPDSHIGKMKCGCPYCCKNYSNVAITWLNLMSKLKDINIQHALNGNEFTISNTKYKADGYCVETNTIYEFHGDYWHGNPKIYNKDDKTYFHKTFGELYEKTLKKEEIIRSLGYNLVVIWESDFKKINKSIEILQKKFRSLKINKTNHNQNYYYLRYSMNY